MKTILLTALLTGILITGLSQGTNKITKGKGGYYINNERISMRELKIELRQIPACKDMLDKATNIKATGFMISGLGSTIWFIVMFDKSRFNPAGHAQKDNLTPSFILLGSVLSFTPFRIISNRQFKKAILLYNNSVAPTSHSSRKVVVDFRVTSNGAGVFCRF